MAISLAVVVISPIILAFAEVELNIMVSAAIISPMMVPELVIVRELPTPLTSTAAPFLPAVIRPVLFMVSVELPSESTSVMAFESTWFETLIVPALLMVKLVSSVSTEKIAKPTAAVF